MSFDLIPFLTTVGTTLGVSWLAKGESGPLETLNSLWYLAFGNFNEITADKRFEAQINREKLYLKDSVEKIGVKLGKIPEEYIQEPRENIVKPAFEALKIYNSEEELRNFFTSLITSAMDSRMNSIAHPSFVEIIKQLSPADAQNLKTLYKNSSNLPIAKFDFISENEIYFNKFSEVFIDNPEIQNQEIQATSITNLDRLGLVKVDYTQVIADKNRYEKFKSIPEYLLLKQELETAQTNDAQLNDAIKNLDYAIKNIDNTIKNIRNNKNENIPKDHPQILEIIDDLVASKSKLIIKKNEIQSGKSKLKELKVVEGYIKLTSLGRSFCTICLS